MYVRYSVLMKRGAYTKRNNRHNKHANRLTAVLLTVQWQAACNQINSSIVESAETSSMQSD
jgi:hypothetical protein